MEKSEKKKKKIRWDLIDGKDNANYNDNDASCIGRLNFCPA